MKKRILIVTLVLALLMSLIACKAPGTTRNTTTPTPETTSPANLSKGPVTIATMIDSEGAILGNMMLLVLEKNGFKTVNKIGFGTPDILRKALEAGEVSLVIDYTGSGQYYGAVAKDSVWSDPIKGYEAIKNFDKGKNNIYWLSPSPANNTEMLAVKKDFAEKNNIKTMKDFANYVNKGGKVKLICASSFAENTKGLLGYEKAYGFTLKKQQMIILSHGNTAEMLKALNDGTNNVNVSLVYGTDGSLDKMNMMVLDDPLGVPPVYLPAPVIRGELVKKYPELENMFTDVFASLSREKLQALNARVAFDGEDAKVVAEDYLKKNGFLK